MKKLTRIMSVACAAALCTATFAGCGSQKSETPQPSSQAAATATAESTKPVTMRFAWWGGDARHKATLAAIEAYRKLHPNVNIEGEYGGYEGYQQKLMTQLAGGAAPDLMQTDPIWNIQLGAQKDNFVDFGTDKTVDMTQFDSKLIQGFCTANGAVIGLPMGINGYGVQMSKSFMQKYGLATDKAWTWDDVIAEGKKIHDKDKDSYLLLMSPIMLQITFVTDYLRGKTGKYWLTDDYTLAVSRDELTDMFGVMKNLFDSGAAAPYGEVAALGNNLVTYPKLVNGQVGMVQDWSGMISAYKPVFKPDNFTVGTAVTVKGGKDTSTSFKPSMLLSVNKKSSNAAEALKFTSWFINDKAAAALLTDTRSIPASASSRKALTEAGTVDKDVIAMVEATQKNPAQAVPLIINNSEIAEITKDVNSRLVFGKLSPEQAADELVKRINDKLTALKAKK